MRRTPIERRRGASVTQHDATQRQRCQFTHAVKTRPLHMLLIALPADFIDCRLATD